MHITDAAYAVAHDYPGGTESLAPRLGMSGAVLRNKVNPNNTTHHLTLAEAVRMSQITGDVRIAEAIANELGFALVKTPSMEECNDAAIVELMGAAWATHGEVGKEICKTLEDGRVEFGEVDRIEQRIYTHAQVLFNISARLRGMAE
ncbi:phage regulatory CII family protein [Paraburkholderia sp. CNPSo 3272]|uniref:phage regulatory CII family protein n=1 Tax=Paraburkholderia sp. CNPSo 3272 TaxID=2940931 RepID=UPI0020B8C016|nr:phage regulatory CII family protein [Paraburkholderia sp. CNPSo 3272]MCP3721754.1 phage regulatory CII family protein [Paraburkholderia sp. CNPSo 3272]